MLLLVRHRQIRLFYFLAKEYWSSISRMICAAGLLNTTILELSFLMPKPKTWKCAELLDLRWGWISEQAHVFIAIAVTSRSGISKYRHVGFSLAMNFKMTVVLVLTTRKSLGYQIWRFKGLDGSRSALTCQALAGDGSKASCPYRILSGSMHIMSMRYLQMWCWWCWLCS